MVGNLSGLGQFNADETGVAVDILSFDAQAFPRFDFEAVGEGGSGSEQLHGRGAFAGFFEVGVGRRGGVFEDLTARRFTVGI